MAEKRGASRGLSLMTGPRRGFLAAVAFGAVSFSVGVLGLVLLGTGRPFDAYGVTRSLGRVGRARAAVHLLEVHEMTGGFGASSGLVDAEPPIGLSSMIPAGLRSPIAPGGTATDRSFQCKAVARGARVWACPWTPPDEWKSSHDKNNGGELLEAHHREWAVVSFEGPLGPAASGEPRR